MNNSKIIQDNMKEEEEKILPILREKATKLSELVEALSSLSQSGYWQLVQQEYDLDLQKLISRLKKEESMVEIYRLQGEIKRLEKSNVNKMLDEKRLELEITKRKLNEPNYGE